MRKKTNTYSVVAWSWAWNTWEWSGRGLGEAQTKRTVGEGRMGSKVSSLSTASLNPTRIICGRDKKIAEET